VGGGGGEESDFLALVLKGLCELSRPKMRGFRGRGLPCGRAGLPLKTGCYRSLTN